MPVVSSSIRGSTSVLQHLVGKAYDLSLDLSTSNGSQNIDARVDFRATATDTQLQNGTIDLVRFNTLLFDVDYSLLDTTQVGTVPVIAMVLDSVQSLNYDANTGEIDAVLTAEADFEELNEAKGYKEDRGYEVLPYVMSCTVQLEAQLAQPIDEQPGPEPYFYNADLTLFDITCAPLPPIESFDTSVDSVYPLQLDGGRAPEYRGMDHLPIRPVVFATNINNPNSYVTGAALPSQIADANDIWGRVGFGFLWRPTIVRQADSHGLSDESHIRACGSNMIGAPDEFFKPADPTALEVFVCRRNQAGGTTVFPTRGSTRIVMGDGYATSMSPFNPMYARVLAHEIGHALGMAHPGDVGSTLPQASSGTVMCSASLGVDHLDIQSTENGSLIANALLTGSIVPAASLSPDCAGSATCGSCP